MAWTLSLGVPTPTRYLIRMQFSQGPRMEELCGLPETKVDHACKVSTVGFSSTCRPRLGLHLGNDLPQGWGDVVERGRGHCIHLVAPIIHFFGGRGGVAAYDKRT